MTHERIYPNKKENVYFDTYIIDDPLNKGRKKPIIVICPGGAYQGLSEREAEPIALAFNAAGYHAVVLYYSLRQLFPESLKDISDTVCIIRDNADKWNVDSDKVIVCGFSAGGHLAASLGVWWNREQAIQRTDDKNKPNGMILAYPVISSNGYKEPLSIKNITNDDRELMEKVSLEKNVTEACPPAFIWHTFDDGCVPVQNSLCFADALAEKKISTELHVFPNGPHGLSLANELVSERPGGVVPEAQEWINMAVRWVKNL